MACPILIIGAGESGIAVGYKLKQLGQTSFRIVDRHAGIGGTWWINRYPGLSSDVPAIAYSYSFSPYYTSRVLYPGGEEFRHYLRSVAEKYGLDKHIELNTDVSQLRFLEDEKRWEATLSHLKPGMGDLSSEERRLLIEKHGPEAVYSSQETILAKIVISCVGILVEPNPWPKDIPGRHRFKGDIIHSARWNSGVDFTGKDVVVIGSGSSAAQIVPALLNEPYSIRSLTQLMRTPPWVMPRLSEPFGKKAFARWAPTVGHYFPIVGLLYRWNEALRSKMEQSVLQRMYDIVPKRYHEIMTPKYAYGCKRRIFDSDWLPSMRKSNFALTTRALKALDGYEVVLGEPIDSREDTGSESSELRLKTDIIILANGYQATRWLHPLRVYGRGGKSLEDTWAERGGPSTYMSMAVDGFPNFFMVLGPNTGNGHHHLILATEMVAGHVLKIIQPILRGEADCVEVKKVATLGWTKQIQKDLQDTVFAGCSSWYMESPEFGSVLYPRSQTDLIARFMVPKPKDWNILYKTKTEMNGLNSLRYRSWWIIGIVFVVVAYWYTQASNQAIMPHGDNRGF